MDIVLDSSSIFNLINGDCIDTILSMTHHKFYVGDLIFEKEILDPVQQTIVEGLMKKGIINLVNSSITASTIIGLQTKYNLGLGETECMAICGSTGYSICTDDLRARNCSKKEIGENNAIGTLYLLRDSVRASILECTDAINAYKLMKKKGAFLPSGLSSDYFCT